VAERNSEDKDTRVENTLDWKEPGSDAGLCKLRADLQHLKPS
jgi:hypothetical protein